MAIDKNLTGWNSWSSGPLRSGPMLGEVGESDAYVWAQAKDGSKLTLTVTAEPPAPGESPMAFSLLPPEETGRCVVFHVTGLDPGKAYRYSFSNGSSPSPGVVQTYDLRPGLRASAKKAKIAFGSCFKRYSAALPIFDSIKNERADLFMMIGDNCYFKKGGDLEPPDSQFLDGVGDPIADFANDDSMMRAQLRHRNNDSLRKLIPNISVLGIWDDHDFGPDNADSTFGAANQALNVFKLMWAQRRYGTTAAGGIFSAVRCGPVHVFLLDGRSQRVKKGNIDADHPTPQIVGPEQLDWLKGQLQSSTAAVKLIVSDSVVLPEFIGQVSPDDWEGWKINGPAEREKLLSFIEEHNIKGVIFVSGDLHQGYLYHRPARAMSGGKRGPAFWEMVSSPLCGATWSKQVLHGPKPIYDSGVFEEVTVPNYGLIDVDLGRTGKEIRLSLRDENGQSQFQQDVALDWLRVQPEVKRLSAMTWPDGKAYFFRGDNYVRYTISQTGQTQVADAGYPKPIQAQQWPGVSRGIDAGFVLPNQKAYLFRGNGYVRYSTTDHLHRQLDGDDGEYPKYISRVWEGFWPRDFDAVVLWPNGKLYFFKGRDYVRCDWQAHVAEPGYALPNAKPILGNWPGLGEIFPEGIDAAVVWSDAKAYFFKDDLFVRYNIDPAHEGVDPGYPKHIAALWPDLGAL